MFMGPLEASKSWSNQGVEGARKFLDRLWREIVEDNEVKDEANVNFKVPYIIGWLRKLLMALNN